MWQCKKCAEEIEDSFDSCWKCSTPDDGSSPRLPSPSASAGAKVRSERGSPPATRSVTKRYSDAYLVARTITGIGALVKRIALILGGAIFLIAVLALTQGGKVGMLYALAGTGVALVVTIPIYVLGILVAAQGEILKATLDSAVTNSPFLESEEMAKVMSL